MRKLFCLFAVSISALVLTGCFASPSMRMSEPADSAEFAGMTVRLHPFEEVLGSLSTSSSDDASRGNYPADLKDLIVDSIPALDYKIGPLDMVQVVVWEHPELTSPMGQYQPAGQKVTTDGKLFYPYAGEIEVAGMTAQELRDEITKRLSDKILTNPQVDVRVSGYNSLKVHVSGAVVQPGFVAVREDPLTLPAAISAAGGMAPGADAAHVQIRRNGKIYTIDYNDAFRSNLPLDKLLLKPNDQVWIPNSGSQFAYILGEVGKPGVLGFRDGRLSLMDALASAGGLQTTTASASSIYVFRNTSSNQIDVYHLNAKNALALTMADRFSLQERDIIYVDASGLATWNRLVSQILPTVQTIYYGVLTTRTVQQINSSGW